MEIRRPIITYKQFYFGKLNAQILKNVDAEDKTKRRQLIREINQGLWTEKQKKTVSFQI